MDMFDRLKATDPGAWRSYVEHEFVRQLGAGTLPQEAFRTYLVQDYLFLIQFARAWALAAYKSRRIADIRASQAGLAAILDETELHVSVCARWGLSPDVLENTAEHRATVAYSRFVLDCGAAGDLLELHVALAPCVIGYAEIGRALAATTVPDDHPYREWIAEYAGEAFQGAAAAARRHLDELAARSMTAGERFAELAKVFASASRLEADFWQMGLEAVGAPLTALTPAAKPFDPTDPIRGTDHEKN